MSWNCEHTHPSSKMAVKNRLGNLNLNTYIPAFFFIWNIKFKLKSRRAITIFLEPVVYSLFSCFSPHDQVNVTKVSCEMDCSDSTNCIKPFIVRKFKCMHTNDTYVCQVIYIVTRYKFISFMWPKVSCDVLSSLCACRFPHRCRSKLSHHNILWNLWANWVLSANFKLYILWWKVFTGSWGNVSIDDLVHLL